MTIRSLFCLQLCWLEALEWVEVEFTVQVTRASPFKLFFKCGRAYGWWITDVPFSHAGQAFRRDIFPSSSSTQWFFWDIFSWSAAQTTTVTHCENEPKALGKVGQKASKISCRKPFVAPNQSERGLMTAVVGSGGLSGGAVTNRQPCSRDDERWRPEPRG